MATFIKKDCECCPQTPCSGCIVCNDGCPSLLELLGIDPGSLTERGGLSGGWWGINDELYFADARVAPDWDYFFFPEENKGKGSLYAGDCGAAWRDTGGFSAIPWAYGVPETCEGVRWGGQLYGFTLTPAKVEGVCKIRLRALWIDDCVNSELCEYYETLSRESSVVIDPADFWVGTWTLTTEWTETDCPQASLPSRSVTIGPFTPPVYPPPPPSEE